MSTVGAEKHAGLSVAATALLEQRARAVASDAGGKKNWIGPCLGESAPLSAWQRSIWLFEQLHGTCAAYNSPYRLHLCGNADVDALERSIREIFRRHTVLRSRVQMERGEPIQTILPADHVVVPRFDFSELTPSGRAERYLEIAEALACEPFDLAAGQFARVTLVRLTRTEHVVLVTLHHVASDGWSASLFFQELSTLYNAFSEGRPTPLSEPPIQYRDYVAWQNAQMRTSAIEADVEYWMEQLANAPPLLELPIDRPRPSQPDHAATTEALILPGELTLRLRNLGCACEATLFMILLAAFQVLLARLSGVDDVVTGIPVACRDRPGTEAAIGCFINVLPLRSRVGRGTPFRELLCAVRSSSLKSHAHKQLPFAHLVERLRPERSVNHSPITQVQFNYRCDIPPPFLGFHELQAVLERVDQVGSVDPLALDITRAGKDLRCGALYSTELFDDTTIRRWLGHYRTLLEGIVEDPDATIGQLPLLTAGERAQVLARSTGRPIAVNSEQCVHRLIEAQVLRAPDAVAAVFVDEELTYAQLDSRANALAHKLAKFGVSPDTLVGVCLERSLDLVIALVAVWKAGGGYVPLDPTLPKERLAYIATDSGACAFIASNATAQLLPDSLTRVLCLSNACSGEEVAEAPDSAVSPGNLAYVIYTSGSTGRPKGVAIEHRSVCNCLLWLQRFDPLRVEDTALQRTSINFDISVEELFQPLVAGARLILVEPGRGADLGYLASLIEAKRVTVLVCVPTLLAALLEEPQAQIRCASLRRIHCAGEAMSPALLQRCLSRLPGAVLCNLYGPTETTIYCAAWPCDGIEAHTVPIGFPIANSELYVLDPQREPVPIGVTGELYVGGIGVARGYVGRPDLTRAQFLPNPFRPNTGGRIYRTGDHVRRRPDGALEFLGRNDDQVKIRGMRIELGEIEAVMLTCADVSACAVSVHRTAAGDQQLVGYVVPAGAKLDTHAVRRFLAERLPETMVPSWFVTLEALPSTSSGKVDRARLPEPGIPTAQGDVLHAFNALQRELVRIWEAVLGISPIGITDNFFELGGHSLLVATMMDRVASAFDIDLPLQLLFREPTVYGLAAALVDAGRAQADERRSPVQCVQAGEQGRPPLFLFHGDMSGVGLYARKLVQRLDRRQPVYVLPPHTSGGLQTVESMAQDDLPHIREIWPGPYLLAGYCNGGLVALEVARQLRAIGQSVDFLAVIDLELANARLKFLHRTVHAAGRIFGVDSATRDKVFLRLREPLVRFRAEREWDGSPWRPVHTPLAALRFAARGVCRMSYRIWRRFRRLPPEMDLNPVDAQRSTLPDWQLRRERRDFMGRVMALYMPRPYPGRITTIFSQPDTARRRQDPFRNWRAIAADVDGWMVSGDHFSIVTERIDELAKILRVRLPDPDEPAEATNGIVPASK